MSEVKEHRDVTIQITQVQKAALKTLYKRLSHRRQELTLELQETTSHLDALVTALTFAQTEGEHHE